MRLFLIVLSMVLIFSSCNVLPTSNVDDLLEAPMLNQMQKEVSNALKLTLDTSQIVYSHPQSGEHRSPFVFFDLDDDGLMEAIVFYSYSDTQSEISAKFLTQENGKWRPVYDIPSRGSQVEFIQFSHLVSKDYSSIIIGWSGERQRNKILSVHSLDKQQLNEELVESFSAYQLMEFSEVRLSELVLVQQKGNLFYVSLYRLSSRLLQEVESTPLYEETTEILQILSSTLDDGQQVLFIDEKLGGSSVSYGTEIVSLGNGSIGVIVGSESGKSPSSATSAWIDYNKTFRTREILSIDLLEDNRIKVPRIKDSDFLDSPEYTSEGNIDIIEYMEYGPSGFIATNTAAINQEAGYILYFPEKWIDQVTVVKEPQRREWRICRIDPISGQASTELFRVRVYYAQDYLDEFTKDDIFLGTRGLFSYYGYIPQTEGEPLAITQQEAESIFALT